MQKYFEYLDNYPDKQTKNISTSSKSKNELFTLRSLLEGHQHTKAKTKSTTPLSPITFGVLKNKLGKLKNSRFKTIKILIGLEKS